MQQSDFSELRQAVCQIVAAVPRGRATSYGAVARALGRPGWARLVGRILGSCGEARIPAHRVVDSRDGFRAVMLSAARPGCGNCSNRRACRSPATGSSVGGRFSGTPVKRSKCLKCPVTGAICFAGRPVRKKSGSPFYLQGIRESGIFRSGRSPFSGAISGPAYFFSVDRKR